MLKIEKDKISATLWIAIALYCSGSGLGNIFGKHMYVLVIGCLALILFTLHEENCAFNPNILLKNSCFLGLCLISSVSFLMNLGLHGISVWITYFTAILYAAWITGIYSKNQILKGFIRCMEFISWCSLICYILFQVLKCDYSSWPLFYKEYRVSYYTIALHNIWVQEAGRNCGPFWEPSIFAAYLTFALILLALYGEDKSRRTTYLYVLYSITIITTKSTGGYILLLMVVYMTLWKDPRHRTLIAGLSVVGLIASPILYSLAANILLQVNYEIFSKFFLFSKSTSSMTRVYSWITNIHIFLDNMLAGVGMGEVGDAYLVYRKLYSPVTIEPAQTSTTTVYLAAFGLGGIYYTLAWIKGISQLKACFIQKIIVLVCILFILNQTPHTFFVFTYIFLFWLTKSATEDGGLQIQ